MIKFADVNLKLNKNYAYLFNINFFVAKGQKMLFVDKEKDSAIHILRLLAKLESNHEGKITINNINIKDVNFKKFTSLLFLPEHPVFFENRSVFFNLKYVLKIRKTKNNQIKKMIQLIGNEYKILDLLNKKIKNLHPQDRILISLLRGNLKNNEIVLLDNFDYSLIDSNKKIANAFNALIKPNVTVVATSASEQAAAYFSDCKIKHISFGSLAD